MHKFQNKKTRAVLTEPDKHGGISNLEGEEMKKNKIKVEIKIKININIKINVEIAN